MRFPRLPAALIALALICPVPARAVQSEILLPPQRSVDGNLSRAYAEFRSQQLGQVHYKLHMILSATDPDYHASEVIEFTLLKSGAPVTIDFAQGRVTALKVNGTETTPIYNGWFITIDPSLLEPGPQRVEIDYSRPYSNDSSGLYRFSDPEDGRAYVYSDFEPYFANRLFPCFDQPDLKASYELTVDAPKDWEIISSLRESGTTDMGDMKRWTFPRSQKFSTYLFPLHAGPYRVWKSRAGRIPLRLFARRSLAPYVDAKDWLKATRQGLNFYQRYFDIPYPFTKYDQIIVPDFLSGAMENIGAVTFSERYIKRGRYTQADKEAFVNTLLHEMAHMWFGDMVTMHWWNGLWLNESFATYMSNLAQSKVSDFRYSWLTLFTLDEWSAYDADAHVTRHPIDLPVPDTDSAYANFDPITYGKGASTLKQLAELVGEDKFRQGVHDYLKAREFSNSELSDFMEAIARVSGRELGSWTDSWLYKAGTNILEAQRTCDGRRLLSLKVQQEAGEGNPPLREHRVQVALFKRSTDGSMELDQVIPVTIDGANSDVPFKRGTGCPAFIFPNYQDWTFAGVRLSDADLFLMRGNINRFKEPLMRAMLWRGLWNAFRHARLALTAFSDILLDKANAETNGVVLQEVLDLMTQARAYFYLFGDKAADRGDAYGSKFEELAWSQISNHNEDMDLKLIWLDHFIAIAHSQDALDKLAGLLQTNNPAGLTLDQDRRWAVLEQLSAQGYRDAGKLAATEAKKDTSASGLRARIGVDAAKPDPGAKEKWLKEFNYGTKLMFSDQRVAMRHLLPMNQVNMRARFLQPILSALPSLTSTKSEPFLDAYSDNLLVGYCSADSVRDLDDALRLNHNAPLTVIKALRVARQEDELCVRLKSAQSQLH